MLFSNINVGTAPDDHTGDSLRVAFEKINLNFANVTTALQIPVTKVAGRTGNILLTVNDVTGAVSIGSLNSLVANSIVAMNSSTIANLMNQNSAVLSTAEAYTNSAISNLAIQSETFTTESIASLFTISNVISSTTDLSISGNLIISNDYIPSSPNAAGTTGQIAFDSNYIYVCIAENTWLASAVSTW